YELVAGRVPFDGETLPQICVKVMNQPHAAVSTIRPGLPPAFDAVVSRCLEKDRARRYQTVLELARALAPFAPSRAQASVERIAGVLAEDSPTLAVDPEAVPVPIPGTKSAMTPAAVVQTNVSWTRTDAANRVAPRVVAIAIV